MAYLKGSTYDMWYVRMGDSYPLDAGGSATVTGFRGLENGDLPVLQPDWMTDERYITTQFDRHLHVAWQFIPDEHYSSMRAAWPPITGREVEHVMIHPGGVAIDVRRKPMRCLRDASAIPPYESAHWTAPLEAEYACKALANGRCPHRGTPVEAMWEVDGNYVCPAHGLRWSKASGALVPRKLA